jgi:transcriptional regulator with XRE-family HTH domain
MNKVKAWRKARSLTQERAAELLAITPRHYQRLEAGHRPISPMIERIMQLI